jgi:hypothetical protein
MHAQVDALARPIDHLVGARARTPFSGPRVTAITRAPSHFPSWIAASSRFVGLRRSSACSCNAPM